MNTHTTTLPSRKATIITLWLVGAGAAISILPVLTALIAQSPEELPLPIGVLQLISMVQTSIFIAVMAVVGTVLAPKVGLSAPLLNALLTRQPWQPALRSQLLPGVIGGIVGGAAIVACSAYFTPQLPAEFLAAAQQLTLPLSSRLLYGGITEEILLRWGVMTLLVWLAAKALARRAETIPNSCYLIGIVLSSLLFGIGHLPFASTLTALTPILVSYIIIANSLFGLIAGALYWKRGLESAMIAHIVAHLFMYGVEMVTA